MLRRRCRVFKRYEVQFRVHILSDHNNQNVRQSSEEIVTLRANVGQTLQAAFRGTSDMAAIQEKKLAISRDMAVDVQSSLEMIQSRDVQALLGAFGSIRAELV